MKLLRDTWLLFAWESSATLHNPVWAIIGLFQPLCYLFLFAPLLQSLSKVPGFPPGGALTVFTPGVLVMMAIFGSAFTGFGLVAQLRAGFIERLRVTPLNRLALSLGRILRDCMLLLVQSLLLVIVALPLGVELNPFSYAVNTARTLFNGEIASGTVSEGFLIIGVLALLALIWVTRSFRRAAV